MKPGFITLGLVLGLYGTLLAADRQTSFTLTVDPPDASIKVVSGSDLQEQTYRSPAGISATVAGDRERAKKNVVEISRSGYKAAVLPLQSVRTGEVLKVRLEKIVQKQLKFRMVAPKQSDTIMLKDGMVQISLSIDDKQMQMSLTNKTPWPMRVLWQRASYTDAAGQQHRIMHPGIRFEERNRSFPYQTIMPFVTVSQPILPVDMVVRGRQKNSVENLPLFTPAAVERFKGKTFDLLLPIEIESKGVVPYVFKVKVMSVVE